MRRLVLPMLLLTALLFGCLPVSAEPVSGTPTVSSQSAVLMDARYGLVLFEKDADRRLPMASTTKIMTALTALANAAPETVIRTAPEAVGVEGSSVYLSEGEELTLEQLLYALLLQSANDAAAAIAVGVGGSIAEFADLMNAQAQRLGLTDTHFANPHGLDADGHYTTARELAVITREALSHPLIRKIVGTRRATIPQGENPDARLLVNHHRLLRTYPDAIGVKTGFTKKSGRCLVSAAERDGVTLIAVTLNAPDDWRDHTAMLTCAAREMPSAPFRSRAVRQRRFRCMPRKALPPHCRSVTRRSGSPWRHRIFSTRPSRLTGRPARRFIPATWTGTVRRRRSGAWRSSPRRRSNAGRPNSTAFSRG